MLRLMSTAITLPCCPAINNFDSANLKAPPTPPRRDPVRMPSRRGGRPVFMASYGWRSRRPTRGTTVPDNLGGSSLTAVRGALGLSVAMGMGRFFYTPALPLMVAALNWSPAPGAWIATLNYVGYFIGTLVIAQGWVEPNRFVYRLSLIVSTLGLAAVALSPNLIWQGSIRTIAGIASGLIFVCVTQRIPANSRTPRDGGISYGGVGFGILVSGAI